MNDERLRALYAEGESRREAAGGRPHLPVPTLRALADGALAERDRVAALDHAMACEACRRDFELLRAVAAAAPRRPTRWARSRWVTGGVAAALAATVALGAGLLWTVRRERVEPLRGFAERIALVSPPAGAMDAPPQSFVWRALAGAHRYRFELVGTDGAARYMETLPDTALALPDSVRLAPGEYRWWVTARVQGAQARSALRPFRLR